MKASDHEKVFSGWQIVPLNFHLTSKRTGGDCYNLEVLKAFKELGGEIHGYVYEPFPKPFDHLIWANIFWMSKVTDIANPTIFLYGTSTFWSLFFTIFYIRAFRSNKMIAITHHLSYSASASKYKRKLRRFFESLMCRWADFHMVISRTTKETVRQASRISKHIVIIPPATNIVYRQPRSFVHRKPPYNLINVGYIAPHKGVADLIRATALLSDLDIRIHFVGDYSHYHSDYGRYCQNLVSQLHLQKRVFFHGYICNDELNEMMLQADIYVSPSHLEGYGMSIVEAASYSLPLIISDLAVFREIAGQDAIYFPVGDYRALAENIRLLLSDHRLRMRMSKAIRRRINFDYDWVSMRSLAKKFLSQWWKKSHSMEESIYE